MWSTTRNAQKNPKEVTGIMNSTKNGVCPNKRLISANGLNDHEINRGYDEPRDGVYPGRRVLKRVCSSMMTRKYQEID